MVNAADHNCTTRAARSERRRGRRPSETAATEIIRHLYVHIPFCARICPYCAFYTALLDRPELPRFCKALLDELTQCAQDRHFAPSTIYFGGGTPTALSTSHLRMLLQGFHAQLDLSDLTEWTMEANPGSISQRSAGGTIIYYRARCRVRQHQHPLDVRFASSDHPAMAQNAGQNNRSRAGTHLCLLPDLRRG